MLIKKNAVTNITTLISWQHLFGFLLALICCLWLTGFEQIPEPSLWVSAGLAMAAYSWFGLIPSVFAILWASSRLFPGRVGILMMTEVLVAVISAALFLNEPMQIMEWFGVALIISAGVLEVSGNDRPDA